ncbi:glycosyltransferase family 4 protein [Kineococcus gypseus]|uniref:glycosyltransferase family 4 protein n=1 Tax=Kineococcus gypseus TaxID=1637102 RepID=UPI003D7C99A6
MREAIPRVVYLPRDYPSLSQTFVRNEVLSLRRTGLRVDVIALRHSYTENVPEGWAGEHALARRLPWPRSLRDTSWWALRHPFRFRRMWKLMRRGPAYVRWTAVRYLPTLARDLRTREVLACHTHFAFEHAWCTLYLATLLDVPATITVHAADIYRDTEAAVDFLEQFDAVVNVCTYNEDLLRSHGLSKPSTHLVPCGVDVPAEPPAPPRQSRRVVSVGRMVPKKGFPGLIRAMALVHERVPDATLEIIGGGELEEEVRALVTELGLDDVVEMRGPRSHDESLAAISASSVFVLNCAVPPDGDTDALPVVLREAMARAKPVVTTAVAGIPETLDDTCGWVVAPDEPHRLADALVEALLDPAGAEERGRRARERVIERFTLESTAERLSGVFRTVATRRAARRP